MKSPKISIIIVTYNAMKWAEKCFSSLRKSSMPVDVIVVDNGSTDGTQNYIQTHFPEVEFVQSPENLGFGKANNLGIEIAYKNGADFFYLMNQDAWIFEDSIQKMLEVYNEYPNKDEIGILSPMHLDGSEKNLDMHFERYLARYTEHNRLLSDFINKTEKNYYEIDFVNAAHWLLPRKTIDEIGGFNPYFFYGAEDYDYINRIKFFNKKILISTKSKVVHDAFQGFLKPNHTDKEKARLESMRMQRETRYLNINTDFNYKSEKKSLFYDAIKLRLKGRKKEAEFYKELQEHFKDKWTFIEELRAKAKLGNHAFLNFD